jgi:hypothetical protein
MNTIKAFQKLHQIKQRTALWYKTRQTIVTASNVGALLHLNSHHSYYDLLEKTDDKEPEPTPSITAENLKYEDITPIQWGTLLESVALKHLEESTKSPIGELGLKVHDTISYLGGSPDGIQIIDGKARLIEMKCPMNRKITYQVPIEYWVQMQICMACWPDVEECLYAEYKFELVTEDPSKTDNSKPNGILTPDPETPVYWILNKTWTKVIKYDSEWFKKILPQINNFYNIKYIEGEQMIVSNKRKTRSQTNLQIQQATKTFKQAENMMVTTVVENNIPLPMLKASKLPNLFTVNRLSNYLRDDPILDWFEAHKDVYIKDSSPFLDYYNQINMRYKLSTIKNVIHLAQEQGLTYCILNASLSNLLDIPNHDYMMLKLQYDCHLLNETQNAMKRKVDIIFMGQLGTKCGKYTLWDTYDMMIHRDVFRQLYPEEKNRSILIDFHATDGSMEYIPIKIKLTTLKFLKDGKRLANSHEIDRMRIGAITSALIYDRHKNFAVIPKIDEDSIQYDTIRKGVKWLTQVEKTDISSLYPNMKNSYDSQWRTAKIYVADQTDELTQLGYLSAQSRDELHKKGIKKISELNDVHLGEIRNGSRISNFLPSNSLFLPKIIMRVPIEVFLDFESVSNLNGKSAQIFLAGFLIKDMTKRKHTMNFVQMTVDKLNKDEEKTLIGEMIQRLKDIESPLPIPIYHWSSAEPRLLRESGFELPGNCYWVDLYSLFVNQNATIPGAYGYGLKEIATALKNSGKIKTGWTQGLDGNQAMVEAWLADRYCDQNPTQKFSELEEIKRVCKYNYVDCKVLEEIRVLLK